MYPDIGRARGLGGLCGAVEPFSQIYSTFYLWSSFGLLLSRILFSCTRKKEMGRKADTGCASRLV